MAVQTEDSAQAEAGRIREIALSDDCGATEDAGMIDDGGTD